MERSIESYIYTEPQYKQPYSNHYGYGVALGAGDRFGRGRAFLEYTRKADEANSNGIISFNGNKTYDIDGYLLYITHVHSPWASGEIIKSDLTTQPCYILKINDNIVVESSLRNAMEVMRHRLFLNKENDVDIAYAFVLAHPDYYKQYDWDEMVAWHSLSPTSCADGRHKFSKTANKKSGDTATPEELISFMKNSTSKNIAIKMEEFYLHK